MKKKLISDNGYGANRKEMREGFSDQNVKDKENDFYSKWEEEKKYRDIGFGRDCGNAR